MCGGYRHGVVWGRWRFVNVCANGFLFFFVSNLKQLVGLIIMLACMCGRGGVCSWYYCV